MLQHFGADHEIKRVIREGQRSFVQVPALIADVRVAGQLPARSSRGSSSSRPTTRLCRRRARGLADALGTAGLEDVVAGPHDRRRIPAASGNGPSWRRCPLPPPDGRTAAPTAATASNARASRFPGPGPVSAPGCCAPPDMPGRFRHQQLPHGRRRSASRRSITSTQPPTRARPARVSSMDTARSWLAGKIRQPTTRL